MDNQNDRLDDPQNLLDVDDAVQSDERAWYVIHCYSGYENKVRHSIEQRIETMGMQDYIFDVVVPTEEEIEIKEGKRRTVERRVFPGYILVQMILTEESWYVVRNTPGVTGFVGMGNDLSLIHISIGVESGRSARSIIRPGACPYGADSRSNPSIAARRSWT